MRKFVIERDIAGVGSMSSTELSGAARTSNAALDQIKGIQWQHSYTTADKAFCIYLANSEKEIHEHSRLSGFPATKITEVLTIIDPTTENQREQAVAAA